MNDQVSLQTLNRPGWQVAEVAGVPELNALVVEELLAQLLAAISAGRQLVVIVPVGPLDFTYWAEALNCRQFDGSALVLINMDEYLAESGQWIGIDHPLSFRRFMQVNLYDRLEGKSRIPPENQIFPDPRDPGKVTRFVAGHGGADICYGGIGLSGHLAFNDPPREDQPCDDAAIRNSVTRCIRLEDISRSQICLCGTDGTWDLVPRHAMTVGMSEILGSKLLHLTLLRSWHAGLWRKALLGPVTGRFPSSFVQEHPHVRITATRLAAAAPALHVALRIGG